ncbi:MAG: CPBP family intramembrane glutamate endopeptidase, partial [Cutibacterium avidum]|nr:CPBP family intramembrane glutamate endopeptidase [Cutibacterium avidum]
MTILGVGQGGFGFVLTALVGGHPDAQTSTILLLASFAGVWLVLWLWMTFVEQRPMTCLGLRGPSRDIWIGVAIAVVILVVDVIVMMASGQVRMRWARPDAMATVLIVASLLLFLVQGCAEEVVLR